MSGFVKEAGVKTAGNTDACYVGMAVMLDTVLVNRGNYKKNTVAGSHDIAIVTNGVYHAPKENEIPAGKGIWLKHPIEGEVYLVAIKEGTPSIAFYDKIGTTADAGFFQKVTTGKYWGVATKAHTPPSSGVSFLEVLIMKGAI